MNGEDGVLGVAESLAGGQFRGSALGAGVSGLVGALGFGLFFLASLEGVPCGEIAMSSSSVIGLMEPDCCLVNAVPPVLGTAGGKEAAEDPGGGGNCRCPWTCSPDAS